jgi:hypothetical protein
VVEELVRMSSTRCFEDTGSTSKAFAGEEVDWYVCNVGSFHIRQSMDPAIAVVDNEDVKRWLLVDDAVLSRQAALAAGEAGLETLVARYIDRCEWFEAAKTKWTVVFVTNRAPMEVLEEAMQLLEKCGSTRTNQALQLELDVIGNCAYNLGNPKYPSGSPERAILAARITELSRTPSLRSDPWSIVYSSIYQQVFMLLGAHPRAWNDGKIDSAARFKGMTLWYNQATPLMQRACDNAVGARKVGSSSMYSIGSANTCFMNVYADSAFTRYRS